jgi:hypothetical protein
MTKTQIQIPASVTVPSADLISYRFDIADKKFDEMSDKLDTLLVQNSHFLTDRQVKSLVSETMRPFQDRLDSYRWYIRAAFSAAIVSFLSTLGVILIHR